MRKGIGTPENRERAFEVWREFGGRNVPKVIAELVRRHGLAISAQTLYAWAREGDWDGRMARADAERAETVDLSLEERMLRALMEQRERYETYFKSSGGGAPETQAMYAYTNLVKTIVDIREKTGKYKAGLFLEFLKDLIRWLGRNEPEAVRVIEGIFDDYVSHAREKYGA